MNWTIQTSGIINHYNEKLHSGEQPIRVLNHVNIYWFQNLHPNFINELNEAFDKYGLSKSIDILYGDHPIQFGPHIKIDTKTITLDETFLSYLWCVTHTIYTLYVQTIDYPRLNKHMGYDGYKISPEKIEKATELFNYAKSLIVSFDKWDINNYPNPEKYLAEDRDYVEQPNIFFTAAINFILAHEYIHAIKHIDEINKGELVNSAYIEFEREADHDAIELMKKGIFPSGENQLGVQIGITVGILSMLYFRPVTDDKKHPNIEDRLVNALVQMEISDTSPCWGFALIGIELWANQFGLDITWDKSLNDKDSFNYIVEQIKVKDKI